MTAKQPDQVTTDNPASARRLRMLGVSSMASLVLACQGVIGGPANTPPGGTDPNPPGNIDGERPAFPEEPPYVPPSFVCSADGPRTGATPRVYRLTAAQYTSTVQWAFRHFDMDPRGARAPDFLAPFSETNHADRFGTYALSYGMSDHDMSRVMEVAAVLARSLIQEMRMAERRNHEAACTLAAEPATCVRAIFEKLGRVLYRRPLETSELDKLVASYQDVAALTDHLEGLEMVLRRMFVSPSFLYRDEIARTPDRRLDAYQTAAAISYALRDSYPDWNLERRSSEPDFLTTESLRAEVLTLLGERIEEQPKVLRFLHEFTSLPTLDRVFKSPDTRYAGHRNTAETLDRFFRHVLATYSRDGFFEGLMTDSSVFVSERTYRFYFPDDDASRMEWDGRVNLERIEQPDRRRGILTQPAWLVTHSHSTETHPVGRGRFIAEMLMCRTIPPVPIGVVAELPNTPGATMRERLSEHSREECSGCHSLMDDAGLALERFDHLGRYRETEFDRPIDTAGTLRDLTFANEFELIDAIAGSREARECFVLRNFEFWLGRRASQDDGCTLVDMYDALFESSDYVEMLQVLFTSDSFLSQQGASE